MNVTQGPGSCCCGTCCDVAVVMLVNGASDVWPFKIHYNGAETTLSFDDAVYFPGVTTLRGYYMSSDGSSGRCSVDNLFGVDPGTGANNLGLTEADVARLDDVLPRLNGVYDWWFEGKLGAVYHVFKKCDGLGNCAKQGPFVSVPGNAGQGSFYQASNAFSTSGGQGRWAPEIDWGGGVGGVYGGESVNGYSRPNWLYPCQEHATCCCECESYRLVVSNLQYQVFQGATLVVDWTAVPGGPFTLPDMSRVPFDQTGYDPPYPLEFVSDCSYDNSANEGDPLYGDSEVLATFLVEDSEGTDLFTLSLRTDALSFGCDMAYNTGTPDARSYTMIATLLATANGGTTYGEINLSWTQSQTPVSPDEACTSLASLTIEGVFGSNGSDGAVLEAPGGTNYDVNLLGDVSVECADGVGFSPLMSRLPLRMATCSHLGAKVCNECGKTHRRCAIGHGGDAGVRHLVDCQSCDDYTRRT